MTISTELTDCLQDLRRVLAQYSRMMDHLIAVSIQHDSAAALRAESTSVPELLATVLSLLLQAVGSSSHTLVGLSDAPGLHTRDCYSIARSIVETSVNICYIITEGPGAAERALRHARQKSFQDLERQSKLADSIIQLMYTGKPDPTKVMGLEAEIAEFTSRTGREKGWVDLSIDDRITAVGRRLGLSVLNALHFARFMIYRHSSEILHGTLFGALFFFGATTPTNKVRTPEDMGEFVGQQHMLILFACILALSAVVESFHRTYGFQSIYDNSTSIIKSLGKIPYFSSSQQNKAAE